MLPSLSFELSWHQTLPLHCLILIVLVIIVLSLVVLLKLPLLASNIATPLFDINSFSYYCSFPGCASKITFAPL